jgi:biuret amidohydrolase
VTEAPLFPYRARMNDFRVSPRSTGLIVVDMQYGSAGTDHGFANAFRAIGRGDVVDGFLERVHGTVVPAIRSLQAAFRAAGAPVVFLTFGSIVGDMSDMSPRFRRAQQYWSENGLALYARHGTREMTVLDEIAPLPGEPVIPKTAASGFTASPLERVLWNLKLRELVFCGVTTQYCVESTFRDAADRGFDCVLVEDACADITADLHERGVQSCSAFGRVEPAALVVAELGHM